MKAAPLPFYGNPDNTHCFQASLRMLLKHWYPNEEYSWEDLVDLSGKKPGMWTWPMRGLVALHNRGIEVINWRDFDYSAFVKRGSDYLFEVFGPDKARIQIEKCDVEYEQQNAKDMLSVVETRRGSPDVSDIANLINQGYLVICNVNLKCLNGNPGYSGHFVVIFEVDSEAIRMHDSGPPHQPNRKVSIEDFRKAWEYPDESQRNLMAFRPRETEQAV